MISPKELIFQEKVRELGQRLGIAFKPLPHNENGADTHGAAHALREDTKRILKSLVLEDVATGTTVFALIRGDSKLAMNQVKEVTGCKKLVLAKPERVLEISGFPVGGVPPFAIISCEHKLVCEKVLEIDYVIGSGGHSFLGIEICTADLLKIPKIKVSHISRESD